MSKKHSFTLVELMIVLAILALLAGIVIFVVKPGNILDQVKDYQRVSDLNNISKSINYLNTIQLGLLNLGSATTIYVSLPDNTSTTCSSYALPSLPTGYGYQCQNTTNYQKNDSTGWIPINFKETDNSNILATLPKDPVNNITYYYTYFPGGSFELTAQLTKVRDTASGDNGYSDTVYETGSPNHVATPLVRDINLVWYWPLNEGTGTSAYDQSGHSYTGTITGLSWSSLTSSEQTLYWGASSTGSISTSSFAIPNTGVLAIETWMNSKLNVATYQAIMGDGDWSATIGYIRIMRKSNSNDLVYEYASVVSNPKIDLTNFFLNLDSQWIHIVMVCDYTNKTFRAYRNGVQFGTTATLTGTPLFPSRNAVKIIGSIGPSGWYIRDGFLDDVRIYNRGLSVTEILNTYNKDKSKYE